MYDREGKLIVHRVTGVAEGGYELKGDANEFSDGIVKNEQIVGKVVCIMQTSRIFKADGAIPLVILL